MAQNGLHAIAGMLVGRWMPRRDWLLLGLVLGNMAPDLDNVAVAYATLAGIGTHGLHRTFSHSIFTVMAVIILFYLLAAWTGNRKWNNFGIGLGIGILMHTLLDLLVWFNGVGVLWPIQYELNFWSGFTIPNWLGNLLDSGEFLGFSLYFLLLYSLAQKHNIDQEHQSSARMWMYIQFVLFLVFTVLFFTLGADGIQYIVFGGLYLLSLTIAIGITMRMRRTVETVS